MVHEFIKANDPFYYRLVGTHLRFCWIPQRCFVTRKSLWLKYAYVQIAMYTGPGDPVFEYRYYDKDEFLKLKLTGEV